jgi:hypothetical protein
MIIALQQANERVKQVVVIASSMALPAIICYSERHGHPA